MLAKTYLKKDVETVAEKLGPGLITGAADDDPSGIATYSQAGAQFGYGLLWTMLLTYPLMVGIQLVSARIGRVTGRGLASNMRGQYPSAIVFAVVGLLLLANTINIAADISAMADALAILIGRPRHAYTVAVGMLCVVLQIYIPYARYVRILKWLTLALLAYVGVVFAVGISWVEVLAAVLVPKITLTSEYVTTIVAILGTTISPYLFFWQASQECEEIRSRKADQPLRRHPEQAAKQIRRMKIDTFLGMAVSNAIGFFIILTAAATLHAHGAVEIQSSAQAAEALLPIAGRFAFLLFSLGIIGTGLLAVLVLAGSSAFALSETFSWRGSLHLSPLQGVRFYGVIAVSTLVGIGLGFSPIDPIKALYWAAVVNGVISAPTMATTMLRASNRKIMGKFTIGRQLKALGWGATGVMAAAALVMVSHLLSS